MLYMAMLQTWKEKLSKIFRVTSSYIIRKPLSIPGFQLLYITVPYIVEKCRSNTPQVRPILLSACSRDDTPYMFRRRFPAHRQEFKLRTCLREWAGPRSTRGSCFRFVGCEISRTPGRLSLYYVRPRTKI